MTVALAAPLAPTMAPFLAIVTAAEDPAPGDPLAPLSPACRANDLCVFVYEQTGLSWLAESGYYVLVKPFRILLVIVAALLLRFVLHRMIKRLTRVPGTNEGKGRLRKRIPPTLHEVASFRAERRRQRAQALGSVLRSATSVTIFVVSAMLVISELGLNLAPLIASAGIAGLALGFGAQNLVKDFIAGLFMLLEDQYGVGDVVDVGEASGTVEAVGLRITTIRDVRGVLWYIRNGEIIKVGNKSQGWATVVVDVPVGFTGVEEATTVLRSAATALAEDPEYADALVAPPEVLGVEQITADGAVVRTTAKTSPEAQWRVGRELRRRLTEAMEEAGIAAHLTATRVFVRPPLQGGTGAAGEPSAVDRGVGGAT